MQRILFFLFGLLVFSNLIAQNVGIGTNYPEQNLSVQFGMNIDQANANNNNNSLANGLRFGSGSGEGIASNRDFYSSQSKYNLNFFTNYTNRLMIDRFGYIGVNHTNPYARLHIYQNGDYHSALSGQRDGMIIQTSSWNYQMLLLGADSAHHVSYINADSTGYLAPEGSVLVLQSRTGKVSIGNIVTPTNKLEVDGSVRIVKNLIVNGNKGVIRNRDDKQLVKQTGTVAVTGAFAPYETRAFSFLWPENFTFSPEAYVGNVLSGSGGWAEVVMTIADVNSAGALLFVFNPRNITYTPNFTINVLGLGRIE